MGKLVGAVIGCGRMGAFTSDSVRRNAPAFWFPLSHAEAMQEHDGIELAALCDMDGGTLARAAQTYGVTRNFTDPAQLLHEVRPHVLGIATRTLGRAELILAALNGGTRALHVEKPLCNSVSELSRLSNAFAGSNVFVTYGALRRHFDVYRHALDLALSGTYGTLREVRVNLGSASLYWTHAHSIDLILFSGAGRKVLGAQARLANVTMDGPCTIDSDPTILSASIHFEDGLVGHITQALGSDLILSCSGGEIGVRGNGGRLELYASKDGGYPVAFDLEASTSPARREGTLSPMTQLVSCLAGNPKAIADNVIVKQDILAGQAIAFSFIQSHLEGSRIVDPAALDGNLTIWARTDGRYA